MAREPSSLSSNYNQRYFSNNQSGGGASESVSEQAVSGPNSSQQKKDGILGCHQCNIEFDSETSLRVHLEYHRDSLLTKWSAESAAEDISGFATPAAASSPAAAASLSAGAPPPSVSECGRSVPAAAVTSMQISMAQSMGIQQAAPPHLSTHHTTNILLNSTDGSAEGSPSAASLPSINADVSDFFSQLENSADSATVLTINSFTTGSDLKLNRFHPYEARGQCFGGPQQVQTGGLSQPPGGVAAVQSSYTNYNANFSDGGVYSNPNDYNLGGYAGSDLQQQHDQSGEDIWDMDANTVRRYNPVPDTVSPGPVPTTPTMYGQVQNKPGWESGASSLYPQYGTAMRGQTPQSLPPQPISPGIGGPWIGGALPVKGQTALPVESKRPKSYQCEACDKWFTSSGHLKRHFNTTLHKNAIKQKGDGYLDGLNGAAFSIPSVESRGAPSPCMSLGEESSQSSVCDEFSSQGGQAAGGGPVSSILCLNPSNSRTGNSSPNSFASSNLPNVSPQLLSPPPTSVGLPETSSSPLSGLTQMVGVAPPSTPQPPSNSPLTPGSGISLSPNGTMNGSPAHKNRFSPFRAGPPPPPPSSTSYKVQNLDQRSYPSYPTTFQSLCGQAGGGGGGGNGQVPHYTGEIYMTSGTSSYRSGDYGGSYGGGGGQYSSQYQPVVYNNASYDMGANYLNHSAYTDISGYAPPAAADPNIFPDGVRTMKVDERGSPEGSEGSEVSVKAEPGEFRCNECNKVFNKMCYLKQHNKSFHNGEKPFKCTQCGKRFPVEVLYQVKDFLFNSSYLDMFKWSNNNLCV